MISAQIAEGLHGERLLTAWEEGGPEHPLRRALTLLATAMPGVERSRLAELPLPERNRLLLHLRQLTFGATLEAVAGCTSCDATMEFSLQVRAILEELACHECRDRIEWHEQGQLLQLRAVNTLDLLAALDAPSAAEAEDLLVARCLTTVDEAETLSAHSVLTSAREQFERLHTDAELRCALTCPQCSHSDTVSFDIAHFLWLEVRHAALRLLGEIHTLAAHYGWSENAIVRMSPRRRSSYLGLLTGSPPS